MAYGISFKTSDGEKNISEMYALRIEAEKLVKFWAQFCPGGAQ